MALPSGVTTCTVTVGSALGIFGTDATIDGTVKPVLGGNAVSIVWSDTGQSLFDFSESVQGEQAAQASFVVPHVDQDGFVDSNGDAVKNWSYKADFTVRKGGQKRQFTKVFQVKVGQSTVDLDLVPDGSITSETHAPLPAVLSVNGQTGNVTVSGGGGADLSDDTPQTLGTASAGTGTEASRSDHVHAMPSAADVGARADDWQPGVDDIDATGTADSTTYLRGDGSWATPSGGGSSIDAYSDVEALSGYPAVIAAGATESDARDAIGAGTSNFDGAYSSLSGTPSIPNSADDVGAVPTTRTVNGKALSSDVTLDFSDLGSTPTILDITVAGTAPTSPAVGDLWADTSA